MSQHIRDKPAAAWRLINLRLLKKSHASLIS